MTTMIARLLRPLFVLLLAALATPAAAYSLQSGARLATGQTGQFQGEWDDHDDGDNDGEENCDDDNDNNDGDWDGRDHDDQDWDHDGQANWHDNDDGQDTDGDGQDYDDDDGDDDGERDCEDGNDGFDSDGDGQDTDVRTAHVFSTENEMEDGEGGAGACTASPQATEPWLLLVGVFSLAASALILRRRNFSAN